MILDSKGIRSERLEIIPAQTILAGASVASEKFWIRERGHLIVHLDLSSMTGPPTFNLFIDRFNLIDDTQSSEVVAASLTTNGARRYLLGPDGELVGLDGYTGGSALLLGGQHSLTASMTGGTSGVAGVTIEWIPGRR